ADLRYRRWISEARVRGDWRAVRSQGCACGGMAGGDDRAVVDAQAGVQRQVDQVQGRKCDAAASAEAASGNCLRRTFDRGLQPGGAPGQRMVRVCAGPGGDGEVRRGAADGMQGGGRRFEELEVSVT